MRKDLTNRWLAAIVIGSLLLLSFIALHPLQLIVSAAVTPNEQGLSQSDVFISGTDGYHTYRIPALVVTTRGTLLVFCEGRRNSSSDTGEIDMLVKQSVDGGRSWSNQVVIWHDDSNTCGNACPVVDQTTGTVWLLLTHNLGQDGEKAIGQRRSKGTRTAWVCKSEDDGLTWSKPSEITKTTKKPDWGWYATGPGVGIQLQHGPHAGRLLIPVNYSVQPDPYRSDVFEYGDGVIYSDNHGQTWELGGTIPGLGVDEPQVVELEDGNVMMNMRSSYGNLRVISLSKDAGQTWSEAWRDETLIETPCQASILRYTQRPKWRKSRLLFSNPASAKERVNMTVRLSYDEGQTWTVSRQVYAGPSAYSCLAVLSDMTIGCVYERGNGNAYERITLTRFSLQWLTDGADRAE